MAYKTGDEVVVCQKGTCFRATLVRCDGTLNHEYDESGSPILVEGPSYVKVKILSGKILDVKKENILGPLDIKKLPKELSDKL